MEMMLVKHSAKLSRRPMAGGYAGSPKLRNFWAQPWGELRIHRRVGTWCSASRCLSPEYSPQRLAVGHRGG